MTVLTAADDAPTRSVALAQSAQVRISDLWRKDSAELNRAAAYNEHLDRIRQTKPDAWILFLDADILIPEQLSIDFAALDQRALYGIPRRMCESMAEWLAYGRGERSFDSFPLNIPPVENGKVWGHLATANPAALSGYFQLWNLAHAAGMKVMPGSPNVAEHDLQFALSFPDQLRRYLGPDTVLHLGKPKINWNGRVSPRWECPPSTKGGFAKEGTGVAGEDHPAS